MLKLLVFLGFFAFTNSANDLILGYGCDDQSCQFSIDVDEKMANYVDIDAFLSRFNAIATMQTTIDNLEKNIEDLSETFKDEFNDAYNITEPNVNDFVAAIKNFNDTLGDTADASTNLNINAINGVAEAECFYRNRTQPWVCTKLNGNGFE